MIIDSSAIVASMYGEPDADRIDALLESATVVQVSAATLLECALVVGPHRGEELDDFVAAVITEVVPFDAAQLDAARQAHLRFGRGSGSPARLNFGDCFAYALATTLDRPLLFIGDDFVHTDVRPAYVH